MHSLPFYFQCVQLVPNEADLEYFDVLFSATTMPDTSLETIRLNLVDSEQALPNHIWPHATLTGKVYF